MKLRKKVYIFLSLAYSLIFIINAAFLIFSTLSRKTAFESIYKHEIELLIDKAEQEDSRIFNGFINILLHKAEISAGQLVEIMKEQEFAGEVFIYKPEKGYLFGAEKFEPFLSVSDFETSYAKFKKENTLSFSENSIDSIEPVADPHSIVYMYIADRQLFVGYGSFFTEFDDYYSIAKTDFVKKSRRIVMSNLTLQFFVILAIILFTTARLRLELLYPIELLNKQMMKVGKGEFEFTLPDLRAEELNSMGSQLRNMADHLRIIIENMQQQVSKVEENEKLYKTLIESLPQRIFLKNSKSAFVSCNSAFASDNGLTTEDMYGKTDYDLYSIEEAARYQQEDAQVLLSQEGTELEFELNQNGRKRWIHMVKVPVKIKGDRPEFILGIFWDITDRKQAEREIRNLNTYLEKRVIERTEELLRVNQELAMANEKLEELTLIDPLTGIPNRRSLDKELLQEWRVSLRDKSPVSVLMIDVDFFKLYNDNYGHQAGDECLQKIARCIDSNITRPRDFCARYGGEEMIVILGQTPLEGAMTIAGAIQKEIDGAAIIHKYSEVRDTVSVSIGIAAMIPDEKSSPEDLVSQSDKALYLAKKNGRNRIEVFS